MNARNARLSAESIVETAVALADAGGLEALSMRHLARALGVEAMSLYHHVGNKASLLDAMVDRVVGEMRVPDPEAPWRPEMRRRAHSMREVLHRHSWALPLLLSRVALGPAKLRHVDATLGCLRAAGFAWESVDRAWTTLDAYIYGFTLQESKFPFEPGDYGPAAAEHLSAIDAAAFPSLHAMASAIAAGTLSGEMDFDFGLDLLLDGLDRRSRRDPEKSPSSP